MKEWTFITNHAAVLSTIEANPRASIPTIADKVGITEKETREIIADLEEGGYIARGKEGVGYKIHPEAKMRHKTTRDKAVASLLAILGWRG